MPKTHKKQGINTGRHLKIEKKGSGEPLIFERKKHSLPKKGKCASTTIDGQHPER
jgi:hypothetical protein